MAWRRAMLRGLAGATSLVSAACAESPRLEPWDTPTTGPAPSPTPVALFAELGRVESTYGAQPTSCESFRVVVDEAGGKRHVRNRKPWTQADRSRFRALVAMVTREMGAEPKLFQAWALRESTYQPSALHVLQADVKAATTAWRKYAYNANEEAELEAALAGTAPTDAKFWSLRGRLKQLRRFKGNPHIHAEVHYDRVEPDGSVLQARGSAWAFGYGPFGFNPSYFVQVWDAHAPPWVFCHHDGLAAIVTAVWSARTHQRECESLGFGGSYLALNHRLGRGHCAAPDATSNFVRRLSRIGLNPFAHARLGRKYPRESTDREQLLELLRRKAAERGLLSAYVAGAPAAY